MASKFVIVVGTRGAGKSSVLGAMPEQYKVVNLGDLLLEVAKEEGLASDRDAMRKLDNTTYEKLKAKAYVKLAAMDGNIVVDTHATIQHNGRYIPGLPTSFMETLSGITGLFYIDADVDTLIMRAKKDTARVREVEPKQVLLDNRDISLATFSYYSSRLNIPIYIINNEEGKLQETRKKFLEHLNDAFGK